MNERTFKLEDGTETTFEVESAPGLRPVSGIAEHLQGAAGTLETSLDTVRKTLATVARRLREGMPEPPDEIELTCGLKVSAEVNGFIFAKAAGESTYTVKLSWKKK